MILALSDEQLEKLTDAAVVVPVEQRGGPSCAPSPCASAATEEGATMPLALTDAQLGNGSMLMGGDPVLASVVDDPQNTHAFTEVSSCLAPKVNWLAE
jgi:hypothetical protein